MPLTLVFSLILQWPVFSSSRHIEISSKVFVGSQKISSPKMIIMDGRKAVINQSNKSQESVFNLEFHPQIVNGDKISLRYSLTINEGNQEMHSRGQVILEQQQSSHIFIDKEKVRIRLTARTL